MSALPLLAIATVAVLASGCGGPFPQSALRPSSDFATSLDDLFRGIFFWAVIVSMYLSLPASVRVVGQAWRR